MNIEARLKKLEQVSDSTGTPFELVDSDGNIEVIMMYGTHEQWLDTLEQEQLNFFLIISLDNVNDLAKD